MTRLERKDEKQKQRITSAQEELRLDSEKDQIQEQEAFKGVRGMPRLSETTKDVVSCEKLRGGANDR